MLLVSADHWQRLEQLVELDHAPAAPVAAGWMGPATVLGVRTVCVERASLGVKLRPMARPEGAVMP